MDGSPPFTRHSRMVLRVRSIWSHSKATNSLERKPMPKRHQDGGGVPMPVPVGLPCYGHQPVDFSFRQILSGTTWRFDCTNF